MQSQPSRGPRAAIVAAVRIALLALLGLLGLASCGPADEPTAGTPTDAETPIVAVTIPPLLGLVRPLLPENAAVATVIPVNAPVHGFEPTPAEVAQVSRAHAVVAVGLGIEAGLAGTLRAQRDAGRVIELAGLLGIEGDGHHHHGHDHDHHHHHDHGDAEDPHLWLDPPLVRTALEALPEKLPEPLRAHAAGKLAAVLETVDAVDAEYRERLAPFHGRSIVCAHNAWGRLADRYGLTVAAVLYPVETAEPSPADVAAVARAVRAINAPAIFVEPQFSDAVARRIAQEAGVRVETLDPVGDGDWAAMMRANLDALARGLGESAGG